MGGEVMEEVGEAVLQLVILGVEALVERIKYELQVGVHGATSSMKAGVVMMWWWRRWWGRWWRGVQITN
jgi:hypothetical protein